MAMNRLSRKLAVILHADVVGSTSLVQKNEMLAHERIQAAFKTFSGTISEYGGKAHEIRGDALVAEFDRASDAVTAAIAFQALNVESNATIEGEIKPELRIGISLGEVVIADNTITGAGVVLAQRLEQLAKPGGIVVQGSVSETVPIRMPFEFEGLGEKMVKGFDHPVRAFSVKLKSGECLPTPNAEAASRTVEPENSYVALKFPPESYEALLGEQLKLPDKPSIAVLPFQNMSGDPEQEFFADGMSEDIITSLSKLSRLFVIARNSTFVYKGHAVDVRQIGQELAVNHVLEGSVRRVGNRIRITAQLVETQNGNHLWAESYDRNLDDIFAVQDEITRNIVTELSVNLIAGEIDRRVATGTTDLKAWELTVKACDLNDTSAKDGGTTTTAKQFLMRALDLDKNYTAAWIELGWAYFEETSLTWNSKTEHSRKLAFEAANKAIELDSEDPGGYSLLGHIYMSRGDVDQALEMSAKSIDLGPGDSYVLALRGDILLEVGKFDEGIALLRKALRLCPFPPAWFLSVLGYGFHLKGENELALSAIGQSIKREPGGFVPLLWQASVLIEMGREDDAKEIARNALIIEPKFSTEKWASKFSTTSHGRIKANILAAGFPK
jgi:adenylate cyclase